jgi:hypothetical protein
MDPSTAEIINLTTVPLLCAWAGVTDDLSGRIGTSLGGPPQHIWKIALTPYTLWDNAIHNIPHTPPQYPEAPVLLGATLIEWGSITSLRRASRIIGNFSPVEGDQDTGKSIHKR